MPARLRRALAGLRRRARLFTASPSAEAGRQLFFLRGHMRSGTNWVASVLNLHPQVNVQGEFHFEILQRAFDSYTSHDWSMGSKEPLRGLAVDALSGFVREAMLTQVPRKPGACWIGDRTPAPLVPLIADAPYIDVVRDGRDVCVSWTYHQLRRGGPPNEPHRTDLAPLREAFQKDSSCFLKRPELLLANEAWVRATACGWARYIRQREEMQEAIATGLVGARLHTVRYEELHRHPEREREALYRFLGLDPAEAAPLEARGRTAPGFAREDPDSFYRKGVVGDWRVYATDRFRDWFREAAGEELIRLGYEQSDAW